MIFTTDFLLAKKIYLKLGRELNGQICVLAFMELVSIVVVALAFASCHHKKIDWTAYFFLTLLFAVLINLFYMIMGKAIKKPTIERNIALALWWSLGGMAGSSLLGLALALTQQAQWLLFLTSGFTVLCAFYYLAISVRKTSLAFPLSISGGNLNDPQWFEIAQRNPGKINQSDLNAEPMAAGEQQGSSSQQ